MWFFLNLYRITKIVVDSRCLVHTHSQGKLQKKQYGGVYFCVYRITFWVQFQHNYTPPVLLFSIFNIGKKTLFSQFTKLISASFPCKVIKKQKNKKIVILIFFSFLKKEGIFVNENNVADKIYLNQHNRTKLRSLFLKAVYFWLFLSNG